MKLQKIAVVSKVGSKDSEQAAKDVTKKLLAKKVTVFTISPIKVEGAKQMDALEELKNEKLDLVITLGGDLFEAIKSQSGKFWSNKPAIADYGLAEGHLPANGVAFDAHLR